MPPLADAGEKKKKVNRVHNHSAAHISNAQAVQVCWGKQE